MPAVTWFARGAETQAAVPLGVDELIQAQRIADPLLHHQRGVVKQVTGADNGRSGPSAPVKTATPTCRQRNVPGAPGRWDGKFENCCANDIKVMLRENPLRSMISEDFHSMGRKDPASLNWLLCSVFYFTLLIFKAIKQKIGDNHCAVYRDFGVMLAWMFYRSVPICNTI